MSQIELLYVFQRMALYLVLLMNQQKMMMMMHLKKEVFHLKIFLFVPVILKLVKTRKKLMSPMMAALFMLLAGHDLVT